MSGETGRGGRSRCRWACVKAKRWGFVGATSTLSRAHFGFARPCYDRSTVMAAAARVVVRLERVGSVSAPTLSLATRRLGLDAEWSASQTHWWTCCGASGQHRRSSGSRPGNSGRTRIGCSRRGRAEQSARTRTSTIGSRCSEPQEYEMPGCTTHATQRRRCCWSWACLSARS